ncbi:MAG: hypothetical protein A2511_13435 [Deltaproteobacteria bacterium RIFOXYD12_FULL_50_9]|nr:MAG: hypothetical protein A2511_13435 [Deltaproteobacteria bacterium RIFOXYD12_FULL_50_9]
MSSQTINTVQTSKVIAVLPDTPLTEAISLMEKNNISCLVVVENNQPVGIFTERDLVFLASLGTHPNHFAIKEVMSTSVITAPEQLEPFDAYRLLESNKIRHLVLVDYNGEVAGVITQTDIINKLGLEYFIELKSIEKIMTREVVTISKGYAVSDAVKRMAEHSISCIVVEDDKLPIGILTERDIVRLFRKGEDVAKLTVDAVMSRPVETISADITVHEAANLMTQKGIRRMVVVDQNGRIAGLITQRDIVKNFELKYIEFLKEVINEKEKALLETERQLNEKIVLDNILRYSTEMAIMATDLACRIVYYNPAAEGIFGYKTEDAIGKDILGLCEDDNDAFQHFAEAKRIIQAGSTYKYSFERTESGNTRCIGSTISGIRDSGHNLVGYVLMARDVTKRRVADEEIMRRSNIQTVLNRILSLSLEDISLNEVLQQSLDLILSIPWLAFESKGAVFLAEDEQDILELKVHKELSPDIRKACSRVRYGVCLCGRAAAEKRLQFADSIDERHDIRYEGILPHGHYNAPILFGDRLLGVICIYVKVGHQRNRNEEDFLTAVANTLSGVIVRKQMEKNLIEVNQQLQTLIQAIPDAIFFKDAHGRHIVVNKACEEFLGIPQAEILGKTNKELIFSLSNENGRISDTAVMPNRNPVRTEDRFIDKNGEEIFLDTIKVPLFDEQGNTTGLIGVSRNITAIKNMEEQIAMAKKLESIGVLAGGIAHDFNNLMTGVLGNISLAKTLVKQNENIYNLLSSAEKASLRTKDLTNQLLTFSRGGHPVKKIVDLAELLEEVATASIRDAKQSCEFEFDDNLWPVEVDAGQISQVIQNLVINAQEAMPEGGAIKIRAQNITIKPEESSSLPAGPYMRISVDDRGNGIPQDYLQKIFDPYFTTKAKDSRKGTGLGLAVSYSIVTSHNGYIFVNSEKGTGTSFSLYLPASPQRVAQKKEEEKSILGRGRILLMDDEKIVTDVASEMLESIGYDVEIAGDGLTAVKLYRNALKSGRFFDAVILDLTAKAGMGGTETLQELLEIDSNVKAIVSSGYTNDSAMSEFAKLGFKAVLSKPYTIQSLSKILHEVLEGLVAEQTPHRPVTGQQADSVSGQR